MTSSWRELDGDIFVRGVDETSLQIDLDIKIYIEFLIDKHLCSFDQPITTIDFLSLPPHTNTPF